MPIHNSDIEEILDTVAHLLEIKGENPFRVHAYRNAARTIQGLSQSVTEMVHEGQELSMLPGVGKDLAGRIAEIVETGTLALLTELQGEMPAGLTDLMKVPGLGPRRVAGRTEEEMYAKIGLPFIEPELREDRGEIEAARKGKLPQLLALPDIRGDLHVHTERTDGHDTIEDLVEAARQRGDDYLAVTDHSKHVTVAHGLKPEQVRQQVREIEELNRKLKGFTVLKSTEVDILEDGSLDLPDEVLQELDLTVCSVHYKFNLSLKQQTDRILKAMESPYFTILAHATGRLIGQREPYSVDMEEVVKAAERNGCLLEVNAHPDRLDLNDVHCKMARDISVKVAVSTDTHRRGDLDYMRFGVGQARRGWLEADDVINTRSVKELRQLLRKNRKSAAVATLVSVA